MEKNVKRGQFSSGSVKAALMNQVCRRPLFFARDEEGGMTIIAFFIFLLMLTMGGISIDVMRHEMERTQIQATLDSAVLAGAGAPADATKDDIKNIVEDFFAKSGKSDYLNPIGDGDITASVNARRVEASANMSMNTYLMKLMGVRTLNAGGGATAAVRTPKLEIVLVLDVSGSMRGTKLDNLKTAAKEFITTVLGSSDPGSTVISIVPYSWGVTPSDGMFEALDVRQTHNYSNCLVFEDDDFNDTAIDTDTSFAQRIYTSVEVWDHSPEFDGMEDGLLTDPTSAKYNRTCFSDEYFQILPFSIDETALHDKIESLEAAGSTSSHLGMKWAAGLLDPAFDDILTSLQTLREDVDEDTGATIWEAEIDPSLTDLPAEYDEIDTKKIIVLMGDGQNDGTYMFSDPNQLLDRDVAESHGASDYRGPGSYLHKIERVEREFQYAYKTRNPSRRYYSSSYENRCSRRRWECVYETELLVDYYVFRPSHSRYYPTDGGSYLQGWQFNNLLSSLPEYVEDPDTGERIPDPETGEDILTHVNFSWEEAWGLISPNFIEDLTYNSAPLNQIRGNRESTASKDAKMQNSCNATKGEGVIVYTIGFEVPQNGHAENQLRACATQSGDSTLHYYRASGLQIVDVFGSIAENVQNLRLTQ